MMLFNQGQCLCGTRATELASRLCSSVNRLGGTRVASMQGYSTWLVAMQAVHDMHTSGFCHADLKNSNAMVTRTEGTVTVRLIDLACSQQQKPCRHTS